MKKATAYFGTLILLAAFASSCEFKDLDFLELTLTVNYAWPSGYETADQMDFYLLPSDGTAARIHGLLSGAGGTLTAEDGTYTALSYNHGAQNVETRNENVKNIEFYTPALTVLESIGVQISDLPRAEGTGDETAVKLPGVVCSAVKEITLDKEKECDPTLLLDIGDIMTYVEINVSDIVGLEGISKIGATLSGMSGSYFPVTGTTAAQASILPVDFQEKNLSAGTLKSTFCCFGDCTACSDNFMVFYIVNESGAKYTYTTNVTSQVEAGAGTGKITINVKGLVVPIDSGSFNPSVDVWQEINNNIDL